MTRLYSALPVVRGFFLALVIVFLVGEVGLGYGISEYLTLGLSRVEVYPEQDFSSVSTELIGIDDELERFREELYPLIEGETDDFEKAIIIREWVMNQASKVGSGMEAKTPYGMLAEMREGRAALCNHMAVVYLTALRSVGMEARLVTLVRSIYDDLDTHVTVEVPIDGNWVVIDPTFNCYFVIDGIPGSASGLHRLLQKNERPKNFEVVYGGEVSYPAELNSYYLDPLMLYNNVFVAKRLNYSKLIIPTLYYYYGSSYVIGDRVGIENSEISIRQYLGIAYGFVFPVGFAVSLIAFIVALFIRPNRGSRV